MKKGYDKRKRQKHAAYYSAEERTENNSYKEIDEEIEVLKAKSQGYSGEDIHRENSSSKKKISKIQISTPEKKKSNTQKVIVSIIAIFAIIGICMLIFFIPYISTAYKSYSNGFDTTRIDIAKVPKIYDKDGNQLMVMYGYYDSGKDNFVPTYSSVYTDVTTLPKYVANAFTAIEDETFYDNTGISTKRLLRATFNYIVKGDSSFGGSTITQQLVKVATGDDSRSPKRKAREIGSALYLTDHWSKEKILASYINLVYYGNGAYGIYEASKTYFNCEPKDLNIAQAAILASIPNSPDGLNPYTSEQTKTRLFNRQKLVLKKMLELNLITDEEYTKANEFNIEFSNGSGNLIKNNKAISPYLNIAFDQAIGVVKEDYGCTDKEAIDKLLNGKTNIYLNLDINLQTKAYEIAKNAYPDYPDIEVGGTLTNRDGQVLAVISSRKDSQVDHAYYMTRQTGSVIKPLSVYGPAYDLGLIQPYSYSMDAPVTIENSSGKWSVNNASNTFRGQITITDAIAYSLNTVAVVTLQDVTLQRSYEYLKSFGITSIDEKDDLYYPALALGGLSRGISPYEMAQAYNAVNNDGVYRNITTINRIEIDGRTITKNKNEHQVISADAASKLKISLNAVARYGTGKTANLSNKTTYLKTGTTNDVKDVWTCGFTDDATLCLWGGYDTPAHLPVYNVNGIWKDLMQYYYSR